MLSVRKIFSIPWFFWCVRKSSFRRNDKINTFSPLLVSISGCHSLNPFNQNSCIMKKLVVIAAAFLFSQNAFSQKTVPLDSVAKYEGKLITVCSKVTGTHVSNGDMKNVSLNFGKPFPDNSFSVFIKEEDLKNFKYNPSESLKEKTVCVTGTVKIYKGKPEIVITKEDQLTVK